MDLEFIHAEARANGSTNKEALRVCVIVNREVAAERERCAAPLQQALEALVYHREQTRPIDRTDAAIAALREWLES